MPEKRLLVEVQKGQYVFEKITTCRF